MRKVLGVLSAAGTAIALFVLPVHAAVPPAVPPADPGKLIRTVLADVTEIVKTKTGADRDVAIRQVLQDDFDLPYMGSAPMGTHWTQASTQQQTRLLAAVETWDARAYGDRLGDLTRCDVTFGAVVARPNGAWIVDSNASLPNGQSIKIKWEVHDSGRGLRVTDVKVGSVSMFMTRRADFNSYIKTHGGTVEPLVQELEARAAQ